ncbi:WD40 repeat protein [Flavobacteriaceae bacterium MAR_2010_72]|nr:WD40 repeat protein [Flavobacteriaceae bacterium MAR_2010_72]TVZ59105.1 WD40 repeat protein [Flavobacteriaceae bacterium MAR_2010_105]
MKHFTFILALLFQFGFSQSNEHEVQPFLKDIVSQFPNVRDIAIAPNGNEVMFTAQSVMGNLSAIVVIKKVGNDWGKPQVASFSGQHFDLEPFFSHDGLRLYFVSTRPLNSAETEPKDFDIWYVERTSIRSPWSQAKNMGSPINTEYGEFFPSIAKNGNFYFTRNHPELHRKDDIYVSTLDHGSYSSPKALPDTINTDGYEYNAFISPDESYLIFGAYAREDGFGSGELYITYKTETSWTQAKNLTIANSDKMDYCPFVDSKTNTLYFTSKLDRTRIKQSSPLDIKALLKEFNTYDNGLSRLYKVSFDASLYSN